MSKNLRRDSYEFVGDKNTSSPFDAVGEGKESKVEAVEKEMSNKAEEVIKPKLTDDNFVPGKCLNRGILNERGFYESEVVFKLTGSLADFAKNAATKGKEGIAPVLALSKSCRAFEPIGSTGERINMHAQGNIYLTEIRSTFPCSLMLHMGGKLRGIENAQCSGTGSKRGAHIAMPMEHKAFEDKPRLLVESSLGQMTKDYVTMYPKYLNGTSFEDALDVVKGNDKVYLVDIESPIVDMVNSARTDKGLDEIVPDDSAIQIGRLVIDKKEVNTAIDQLNSCLREDVNYVKLYDALKIRLSRPFYEHKEGGNEWLDSDELEIKARGEEVDGILNTPKIIHVRAIVEHRPLGVKTENK